MIKIQTGQETRGLCLFGNLCQGFIYDGSTVRLCSASNIVGDVQLAEWRGRRGIPNAFPGLLVVCEHFEPLTMLGWVLPGYFNKEQFPREIPGMPPIRCLSDAQRCLSRDGMQLAVSELRSVDEESDILFQLVQAWEACLAFGNGIPSIRNWLATHELIFFERSVA